MSNVGLNTGLRALLAARFALDTIGHNIANANTPGYARQRIDLASSLPIGLRGLLVGTGVDADSIQRNVDDLLGRRILTQRGVLGHLTMRTAALAEIETFLGDGSTTGLGGFLDGFFAAVSDLSAAPDDPILAAGLVESAENLTGRFREAAGYLTQRSADARAELAQQVGQVNRLADELAALNVEIGKTEANGSTANDLRDRRDHLLGELSELVDVTALDGANGSVRVLVAGNTLVGAAKANHISTSTDAGGALVLRIEGAEGELPVTGGMLGGLVDVLQELAPDLRSRLDLLARELVLSTNRVHSTGVPPAGSFTVLTGTNAAQDFDGDGKVADELLSNAGLPFDVVSGGLWVNVVESSTGSVTRQRIEISATHTTVQDFLDELNGIPNLSADLDASGRVRIVADAGWGFDFSRRLDADPDPAGVFGGTRASVATLAGEPFAFADGDTLDLTVGSGSGSVSFQIVFSSDDFFEISNATAEELAAVINADPGAQANGVVASAVAGSLVLQTLAEGTGASLTVEGGNAAGTLGWNGLVGTPITGQANGVEPAIGGLYTGADEARWVFRPRSDGVVGTTPGLLVDVFDQKGELVTSLDVGAGYVPGSEIAVTDGVTASFGLGELSASHGDLFALDLVPDTDTTDVLVALGINGLFTGSNAADIAVNADVAGDPRNLASSAAGAPGDGSLLLELLRGEETRSPALGDASLSEYFGKLVGELGFQSASAASARSASDLVIQSLEARRDEVSGVDIDEELVDLVAFEQSFAAAAQYIQTVQQLGDELLALI
jgi:flagellar hook-associated protein 1 FlgK